MPSLKTFLSVPVALFLAFAAATAAPAQSPAPSPTAAGRISGKSYVNSYFHVSYAWPAILKPENLPAPSADNNPHGYAFPLLTVRQGDQPYGVVIVAEKLNVAGPHSSGIKSSGEYIDRISATLRPGPILSGFKRAQKKSAQGLVFDELNYLQSGKPSSVMATQIGQYLIVFKCSAQSPAEMARMQDSALALRKLK